MRLNSKPSPHHERFEELAALAVAGELNAFELKSLEEHIADCRDCREAYEAFAGIAANDLGVSAAARELDNEADYKYDGEPDTQESLRQFKERVARKRALPPQLAGASVNPQVPRTSLRRSLYGIAATILLAAAGTTGFAWFRSEKAASEEKQRVQQLLAVLESLKEEKTSTEANASAALVQSLEGSRKERDRLQKDRDALRQQLAASDSKNAELLARENRSEAKLTEVIADTERLRQQLNAKHADRERLAKLQQESEGKLREALAELYQARQGVEQAANTNLADRDGEDSGESAATASPVSPNEGDARNLFGARDLHIVDVYDVAGDGQTKRTYGRVYYVEKKLLVFYAFDLQNRQNHKRGVFQAWGYRESNAGKAVSMGLFTMDDSAAGRWVLTVKRPDVLSHIDAVFVTAEPPGGSASPRGKKVLYANLAWPANHP